jgi:hypothetical protein
LSEISLRHTPVSRAVWLGQCKDQWLSLLESSPLSIRASLCLDELRALPVIVRFASPSLLSLGFGGLSHQILQQGGSDQTVRVGSTMRV